ncbi:MAG: BTAD domain-containing putative transcriptional regulator [Gaiellaceae bacterium]
MEVLLLGPLEVWRDGRQLELASGRQRALLAILALNANRVVSSDRLIEQLWGDSPPRTAAKALQNAVSGLRRALAEAGDDVLVTIPPGYRLRLEEDCLDALRFERLAGEARQSLDDDPAGARNRLREALGLWRGDVLAEFAYEPFAQEKIRRLDELRLGAIEDRIDADLALGGASGLVPELEALVTAHRLRERLRGQLMLALYRSGRQADALEVYREGRARMEQELGLEPGARLRQLEQAILTQDPALGAAPTLPPEPRTRRRRWPAIAAAGALAAVVAAVAVLAASDDPAPTVVPDSLVKIDVETNEVAGVVPVGAAPGQVRVVGPYVFASSETDKTLSRIEAKTDRVATSGASGADSGLARAGDEFLWVASVSRAEVSLVRAETFTAFDHVRVPHNLDQVFVAVGGGSLWVSQFPDPAVSRYRLRTLALVRRYAYVYPERTVEVTYGYGAAWVGLGFSNRVLRIAARDGNAHAIRVGKMPSDPQVGFGSVWIAGYGDGRLWRVNALSEETEAVIPVGRASFGMAIGAGSVWVTDNCDGTVSRIDPETNKVTATIHVGRAPRWIDVGHGYAWVGIGAKPYDPCD